MRHTLRALRASLLLATVGASVQAASASKEPEPDGALAFRLIGPAIGGRISQVAGVPGNPDVFYCAAAQGGPDFRLTC